jgi:flagellar motor switch protein FliN/FliY
MSLDPASPESTKAQENDDVLLFEDEGNEQFLKALDQSPQSSDPVDTQQALDTALPDVQVPKEDEAVSSVAPAPDKEEASKTADDMTPVVLKEEVMSPISQAPVQLQLELGKVHCSLQKLIELRPNDVLSLDQPLGQMIDLRLQGRLIGRGQIVKLGDQLGLRISELADR